MRTSCWIPLGLGICGTALLLVGCGGGGGGSTPPPSNGGGTQPTTGVTVSGRVTDATAEAGVSGAEVTITETGKASPSRSRAKKDTTDADGWYAVEDVQPGKATMNIRLSGDSVYDGMDIEIEVPGDRPTASVWVKLRRKDETKPTSVALTPKTPSVTVGATVQFTATVLPASAGGSASFAVQGDVGTINASGVFTASKQGTGTIVAYAGEVQGSTSVTVTAAPATTGTLTGLVTDSSSRALAGATVTADGKGATTGADGTYTLTNVTPGQQSVSAAKAGYVSASKNATVAAGQVTTVDWSLTVTGASVQTKTNPTDGAELIWIPAGTFSMGQADVATPVHQQTVSGFWLYRKEVTNAQYGQFMQATGHAAPYYWNDSTYNGAQQPVVGVDWFDCKAYAEWAVGRLPTEAEWEYAARGGQQLEYATSTGQLSHDLANYSGTGGLDQWTYTSPVGSFLANPFGVYDMTGNVWEWCSSIYMSYPYSATDGREDMANTSSSRVLRGGSWGNLDSYSVRHHLGCAFRGNSSPDSHLIDSGGYGGFRCAQGP